MKKLRLLLMSVIVALVAALALVPDKASAASIRFSCDVYATNQVDPIGDAEHRHRQVGNISTSDTSTGTSLFQNKNTSCEPVQATGTSPLTSAAWFPVEGQPDEPVPNAIIYYRAPGDQTQVVNFTRGHQLIGRVTPGNTIEEVTYTCDSGPGNPQPTSVTPPYNCTENWSTSVQMPRCYDGSGVLTEEHTVYGPNRTSCPASHPVKLPEVNILVRHSNTDGVVPNPLQVSAGADSWDDYTHMHADYFFAAQNEFNQNQDLNGNGTIQHTDGGYSERSLMRLCLRDAPDELEFSNERCRAGGLLPAHETAINNYYN